MSMKPNKLSHSAASRYQDCPKSYEFHYKDRLRTTVQSAALLFGTAVDRAVGQLLNVGLDTPAPKSPEDIFEYFWRFQEVNNKNTYLPTCTDIVYANTDYDEELLEAEDLAKLTEKHDVEDPISAVTAIYERKEAVGFQGLPETDRLLLNHANWLSLRRKGLLMIQAVRTKVLPQITEVLGTQVYVTLENEAGDKIVGYVDLVCRWKGYDRPIVIDFKTSSRDYAKDSVLTSPQLTLYVHSLFEKFQTRLAGFVVLSKHVKKNRTKICSVCKNDGTGKRHKTCDATIEALRCNGAWNETLNPEVLIDVIISEIPEQTENIVLENLDQVNEQIKRGIFTRNFGSCVKPWGKCVYFSKCYLNSDEGLIKMEDRKGGE